MTFGHYGCCATSCCACAPPREPRRGQLTFGSHVTTKKKTREKAGHAQNLLPDRASSGVQPSLLTTTTGVVKFQSHLVAMLLLLRKKRGKNGACAEPTFRSGQLLDRPLPDSASSGNVTFSLPVKRPPLGRIWRNFCCACAEHTSGQCIWLTSLPLTWLPGAPHRSSANVALSLLIYYSLFMYSYSFMYQNTINLSSETDTIFSVTFIQYYFDYYFSSWYGCASLIWKYIVQIVLNNKIF